MQAQSLAMSREVLDALPAHIAVVDPQGTIVFVNRAWLAFAEENDCADPAGIDVGGNYFVSCKPTGDDIAATAAVAGIQTVLRRERAFFEMEYPCHAPTQMRWFVLQVTPLTLDDVPCALVAHHDITNRRLAWALALERSDSPDGGDEELTHLARLSGAGPTAITARAFGVMPLRESLPGMFDELVARYAVVLDQALEQRTYKVQYAISQDLRVMAERLGFARAGPRDVVDIHTLAIRTKLDRGQRIVQAYFEESRVLLLELMGYLASYYRTYAVGVKVEAGERISDAQQGARS